ncbi:ribonuclease H-like protein [Aspergillus saccharolyticus JOP 1030-1]|uniref:ribonuclease H n=1 Tax=Aspergillus saccharolyticus JOP 1030-1 TaxID=1450539 RepID=A0A318ZDK4_9EURO|nr:ribonuclease H-like protein [Aspergillus saccharolyticus JOP 1030-1]PYH45596.1 ribonuclease H-like protein [Aspergillus saccharolyticus JOP 1030-1]
MVYTIEIYVDGGCRGNGQPGSIGAAAAAVKTRAGTLLGWKEALPSYPTPTNQRAEITAIILGLEKAREDIINSEPIPYAVKCMNEWVYKWVNNGWTNAKGSEVANRDVIERAMDLEDELKDSGDVRYQWIPRAQNQFADQLCNECMDEMVDDDDDDDRRYYYSSSDDDW